MKPIYLKPGQSVAVVPMKEEPMWEEAPMLCDDGIWRGRYRYGTGYDWDVAVDEFEPPFLPGEKCYVPETWCLYQTLNMRKTLDGRSFDEISDGLYGYKADGFDTIQDFKDHVRLMSDSSFLDIFIKDDRWQSPAVMPMKASRRFVTIVSCEPIRVSETEEWDAKGTGIEIDGHWSMFYKTAFIRYWHKRHPGKEWAWLIRTEENHV